MLQYRRKLFVKRVNVGMSLAGVVYFCLCLQACSKPSNPAGNVSGNAGTSAPLQKVSIRLQFVPQAQFAGLLIGADKGFFREEGLEVDIRPSGPDLKPQVTVASGSDDMGEGVSNQVITANSNGVPLLSVAQIFQDSANRFVAFKRSGINRLQDVRGKKVGLWTGGDEVEFIAMLGKIGLSQRDVQIIPLGMSVVPFLHGDYAVSQVTVYNELNQVLDKGVNKKDLVIFSPADYGCAIVSDVLFTRRDFAEKHPDVVTSVIKAMLKGWDFAKSHPDEAVDIMLRWNKELKRTDQQKQLTAVLGLVYSRSANVYGAGYISQADYENAERILRQSGQIKSDVDIRRVYDPKYWQRARGGK